jgi:hypothetical protein
MDKLTKIESLIKKNKDEIETLTYYNSMLEIERYDCIKNINSSNAGVNYLVIKQCKTDFGMLRGIIKNVYEVDIPFDKTHTIGLSSSAYGYHFGEYSLVFPTFNGEIKDLDYVYDGKFALCIQNKNSCVVELLLASYLFSDIVAEVKKILNKEVSNEI